ncbi:MAG: Short-chain dehydrogenase [Herminiimonas sp.]|jgi:3-oxoacyl-[acyl-carrier protein] reductase|nr:Short-chain dehydrogenase [Herminiimonas sp.]
MDLNLRGRTALITGGSKGIGFAIARALAAEGCSLRLVARDAGSLEKAKESLSASYPVEVLIHPANLSDPAAVTAVGEAFPEADILVNCAGAVPRGSLPDLDPAVLRDAWEGKVMSTIMLSRLLYGPMSKRGAGVIVNIIGIAGEKLNPKSIGTSVANAALIAFTKAFGAESVDRGVRVVGVSPGLIRTDRTARLLNPQTESDRAAYAKLLDDLPYGRMGEPSEIADLVIFLASDHAKYISGEVVSVDAGSRYRA